MRLGSRVRAFLALLTVTVLVAGCSNDGSQSTAVEPEVTDIPTALVVDGSASMYIDDAPGPRIDAAKSAARTYIDALPDGTDFSLWTYGTGTGNTDEEQEAGCLDTTNLISTSAIDQESAKDAIDGIVPTGWSPIAATMKEAGESLPTDEESTLVVVTDGEDTCGEPTICEVAEELHQSHPQLRIDAVGFMVDDPELNCAATTTGGLYVTADNTEQLTARLAASRDAELSKTTLTGRSFQGIEVGASHGAIASAFDDFPSLSDGTVTDCTSGDCGSDTVTIIRWRDCDWHFTDGGILQLIDPGENSRTIDGFGIGDDAADLADFYGDPVNESSGTFDGDDVTVRWYRSDVDLGLAWRVVIDTNDRIRTIVLCKCLPGTGTGSQSAQGTSPDPASSGSDGHTEIVVYDVFEDDGSVREPFQSTIVDKNDPPALSCASDQEPDSLLRECGVPQTDVIIGYCAVSGNNTFCPVLGESGQVSIEKYVFQEFFTRAMPTRFSEAIPDVVVDMDGSNYTRGTIPGLADYVYLKEVPNMTMSTVASGLRSPNGDYPVDKSSQLWTAHFARGHDSDESRETIPIQRAYYFE